VLSDMLESKVRSLIQSPIPLPGAGNTSKRHTKLFDIGRENLSLARLAEAHWDAVAILAETGRCPEPGSLYGVWASEKPGAELQLEQQGTVFEIRGSKMFCTGAGIVDHALITTLAPDAQLIDIDLRANHDRVSYDNSDWKSAAFAETQTAKVTFLGATVTADQFIGESGWYSERSGFWHGALGPASCWAGGAAGLLDYALSHARNDPHTLAHLGAMHANVWACNAYLDKAGHEIDATPHDSALARKRALSVRHLIEQACSDILRRLPRAYGPHPLAMNEDVIKRYQEVDLYLRQSHAERDLAQLGEAVRLTSD